MWELQKLMHKAQLRVEEVSINLYKKGTISGVYYEYEPARD